jgi:FtsP/CotA-like multicopper oxidase with cupredoxin domain
MPFDRPRPPRDPRFTRREALGIGAGIVGALGAAAYGVTQVVGGESGPPADVVLRARASTVEIGSRPVATWTFDGRLPGPEVRLRQGRPVRIRLENDLPEPTTIHWHGIRLHNAADGVPDFTQDAVEAGDSFVYEFTPPDAGTYFLHSHVGTQLDRGLYAPLIVDAAREELSYDNEAVLVLDDWLDGVAGTPDAQYATLRSSGMNMSGGSMGGAAPKGAMGGVHTTLAGAPPGLDDLAELANLMEQGKVDPGDVQYPLYLINGRPPEAPAEVRARPGQRLRLRLINAAADTTFCFFVDGRPVTVTHSDGQPVEHVTTDALVLGMGERYDVLLDARDDASRIFAMPLGKRGRAVAVLRSGRPSARVPAASAPFRAPQRIASYADLRDPSGAGPAHDPRVSQLDLAMTPPYVWTIAGQVLADADPIRASRGEAQRFVMRNQTMMPHPMHLHGHSFRPAGGGPLKDTILVPPRRQVAVDWVADNPGAWAFHCHNVYHQEAGMMRKVEVS